LSYPVPSTLSLIARFKASIEARLNKKTPTADEAYNTVLAVTQGMIAKGLYAYAADRVTANFVRTAQGADLDRLGRDWDCIRIKATACQLTASLAAIDDTQIDLATVFIGPQNLNYEVQETVVAPDPGASGSGVVITLKCEEAGVAGNLLVGDELNIQSPIAGAGRTATVTAITVVGAENEIDEDFKTRILDAERAEDGTGDSSSYRNWAQAVAGVKRAYPFSGPPVDSAVTPTPVMRTIYIEATAAIDADFIPTQPLLDAVRAAILINPTTGISREILGFTTETLYVEPITRLPIYIQISGLKVNSGTIASAQTAITTAITEFIENFVPFVQGLDPDFERMDIITAQHLGREVQNIIDAYSGTTQTVSFGLSVGTFLAEYALANNERPKFGGIAWVDPV